MSINNKLAGKLAGIAGSRFPISVPETPLPTFDEFWPVRLAQLLQEAIVEALCLLRGHCQVEVGLVALEDALEGELADAQHLILFVHHTL